MRFLSVIIVAKNITKGINGLFVTISLIRRNHIHLRAIGIDAKGCSSHIGMAIGTFLATVFTELVIPGTNRKTTATFVSDMAASCIADIEVPLAPGTYRNRMKTVVMVIPVEAGEKVFALVDFWVELRITIHIGIKNHIGWLGH